jgi:glycolate oxidase FAD binding subunit
MSEGVETLARELSEQVKRAAAGKTPLHIRGGGSKTFYGRAVAGNSRPLDVTGYHGIVAYEPTELVITARAGTPVSELEAALAEQGQMFGFEPPYFGAGATLGGMVACGLSGPRRPYAGSVRDFVLGVKILNGKGEILSFGGQVMKNVAGYDLSRLLTGSLGTLGVILEASIRVLPVPAREQTLVKPCTEQQAIEQFSTWGRYPYPITAAAHDGEVLYVRLAGAASAVTAAAAQIGGDPVRDSATFWKVVREHEHPFFDGNENIPLWRFSLPPATAPLQLSSSNTFIDWGGAQRWLFADLDADTAFAVAQAAGGHASLFHGGDRRGVVFQPLQPAVAGLHQRLKHSFDPAGIFNPGRLYSDL